MEERNFSREFGSGKRSMETELTIRSEELGVLLIGTGSILHLTKKEIKVLMNVSTDCIKRASFTEIVDL